MGTGKFARETGQNIAAYLSTEHAEFPERRKLFHDRLSEAAKLAQPLLEIDDTLYGSVHTQGGAGQGVPRRSWCSLLPFGANHPSLQDARTILGDGVVGLCAKDTPSVLITSSISAPVHPLVVRSLTLPIAKAVQGYHGDREDVQAAFWLWRRSRSLRHFVPVAPEVLEAFICGFAVGRLCGYVTADPNDRIHISGRPAKGVRREVVDFPWPFLSRVGSANAVLAAILESFPLCYAEVGSAKVGAFEAYRRLYDLGSDEPGCTYLADLAIILEGEDPPRKVVDSPKAFGRTGMAGRRDAALGYLDANIKYFENVERKPLTGQEHCDEQGLATGVDSGSEHAAHGDEKWDVVMREILPTVLRCYESLRVRIERLGIAAEESVV